MCVTVLCWTWIAYFKELKGLIKLKRFRRKSRKVFNYKIEGDRSYWSRTVDGPRGYLYIQVLYVKHVIGVGELGQGVWTKISLSM